jgi:putative DNA primase/helicase
MGDQLKKPFHEQVAENLIEQLKQGTAPWQKPWEPGEPSSFIPINPTTGNRYKGINAIHLMAQGHGDQRWMTYKQAAALGAQVRKGEKGTPIQYWKFTEEQTKTDEYGKPVLDRDGKAVKEEIKLERPRVFYATVFNAQQIDGLPPMQRKKQTWDAIDRAEQILKSSGALIHHGEHDRAFYRTANDSIHLPDRGQFPTAAAYYATALHELGHWTGHPSRLDRDLIHPFGSEQYAKEELRAEIASMVLGDELGIGHDPSQHASYVGSWIKVLKNDPLEVFRAAADAEKIQAHVLALEHQLQVTADQSQVIDAVTLTTGVEVMRNDELEKAAELARLREEQVRNDPNSSEEEKAVAKEERKRAEGMAMMNDIDLQRSIERRIAQDRELAELTRAREEQVRNDPHSSIEQKVAATEERKAAEAMAISHDVDLQMRFDKQQREQRPRASSETPKTYVDVPLDESQYGDTSHDLKVLESGQDRRYLTVPYGEHKVAKAAGAMWDKGARSWYVGPGANMEKLRLWFPENVPGRQGPAMSPREEFAKALQCLGCIVKGEHPIMDGKKHRIAAEGDKNGEAAGFYVGHLDGHPAGYIKNNRTGVDMKWKSKGYVLDPEQKAQLQAEAAAKLQTRSAEQEHVHERTAERIGKHMVNLVQVVKPTSYMQAKGIAPKPGVFTDRDSRTTYIPAIDANGKQWTMQYIRDDGTKRFAKDSRKEGCFHPIGGLEAIAKAPAVVISEGYATAASLAEVLGHGTVAAFDSGNLPAVAKALRTIFPEKPFIIAGDNDLAIELRDGINPGKMKAQEAAKAVGGGVFFPLFAPGEQTADPRGFSDFNDLANNSVLGREGLERQARVAVSNEVEKCQHAFERKQYQDNSERHAREQSSAAIRT